MENPVLNVADLPLDHWKQGHFYACAEAILGARLGLTSLGIAYSEVPPGKSGCPFHNHHAEDELFFIIEGTGDYRFGSRHFPVGPGAILSAPSGGQETAHQLINTGTVPLRYLAISSKADTEVVEYPDSGKYLVRSRKPGDSEDRLNRMVRDKGSVDYWLGEPGAE